MKFRILLSIITLSIFCSCCGSEPKCRWVPLSEGGAFGGVNTQVCD